MGQTQILFIVLAVIIVGIAVAVGITQFRSSAVEANKNAVTSDLQAMAAQAELWYKKPTSMGGGGGSFGSLAANDTTSMRQLGATLSNANGSYMITNVTANTITFTGVGTEDGDNDGTNLTIELTYDAANKTTTVNQTNF